MGSCPSIDDLFCVRAKIAVEIDSENLQNPSCVPQVGVVRSVFLVLSGLLAMWQGDPEIDGNTG